MTDEQRKALVQDYRVYAKIKPFPGPYITAADQIEADGKRIEALEAENERLREALTLAANRMDVMALAVIHENNARRYEWHEWAVAARAALGEKQ